MKPYLLLMALFLSACSHYPTPYRDANGKIAYTTQIGGKWMHTINADGSMAFTGDNEVSLQHFFQMLGIAITEGATALVKLEQETTAQLAAGQITKRQAQQQLAAIEQAKIAAGVRGAEVFNPNIALPIRQ